VLYHLSRPIPSLVPETLVSSSDALESGFRVSFVSSCGYGRETYQSRQIRTADCPDEIGDKPSTLAPKSDEPTVPTQIESQIQQRAYELYEQRGRTDGRDLDDWLQAEYEINVRQADAAAA
jgi:hypothetical protein